MEQEKSNTNSPKESNVSKKYSKTSILSKTISKTSLIHKVGFQFALFRQYFQRHRLKSENFLQTLRSTKAASRESREPDSESRQLESTVSSVRDTESSVKNTESSVRSTTGRVSNRDTAPNRDIKGPFEGFHSKF